MNQNKEPAADNYPVEINKILKDFITDILNTFPEYNDFFTENELDFLNDEPNMNKRSKAYEYFKKVYPERFFDILYENVDIFEDGLVENISEITKKIVAI